MPLPATGDITWAASPISSSPGRCQRGSRSAVTDSSETWDQSASWPTRPDSQGTSPAIVSRSACKPGGAQLGPASLGDDHAELPRLAAVDQQQHVAAPDAAGGALRVA